MTENERFENSDGIIIDNETKLHYLMSFNWEINLIVKLLNRQDDTIKQLKAQLSCTDDEGVCNICKHHYLEASRHFYISRCEKGREECSTESLRYCNYFELKDEDGIFVG